MSENLKINISGGKTLEVRDDLLMSFGRDESADLCIKNGQISKVHGEFYVMNGQLFIRDLGSRNGTFVNGQKVENECVLSKGDVVHLGKSPIFKIASSAQSGSGLSSMHLPVVPAQQLEDRAEQTLALSPEQAPSELMLKRQNQALQNPAPAPATSTAEARKINPILVAVAAVVTVIVALALFLPEAPDSQSQQQVYGKTHYLNDLNAAAQTFARKDYQAVIDDLHEPIQKYSQNHAAHILTGLAEIWRDKGPKYENLLWHRAEDLSQELMNVHPTHPSLTALAQNLYTWVKKEEPNMAKLQEILKLAQSEKWDRAYAQLLDFPSDSRFRQTHADDIANIESQYHGQHQKAYEEALASQNWTVAISELEKLALGPKPPEDLNVLLDRYRGHLLDRSRVHQAKAHLEDKKYVLAEEAVGAIAVESPYYDEAQRLMGLTSEKIHEQQRQKLYNGGHGQQAIAYSRQHFPEDQAFVQKVQSILDWMDEGNSILLGPEPERCVGTFQKILQLEPRQNNHYHIEAEKHVERWTAPDHLAELYAKRGKEAELKQDYPTARDLYLKAQQLDDTYGTEELKAFEKKAYQHFNRAMGYAIKEDMGNVRAYLKKALELVPPNSKLYDRIEGYVRRNLKD